MNSLGKFIIWFIALVVIGFAQGSDRESLHEYGRIRRAREFALRRAVIAYFGLACVFGVASYYTFDDELAQPKPTLSTVQLGVQYEGSTPPGDVHVAYRSGEDSRIQILIEPKKGVVQPRIRYSLGSIDIKDCQAVTVNRDQLKVLSTPAPFGFSTSSAVSENEIFDDVIHFAIATPPPTGVRLYGLSCASTIKPRDVSGSRRSVEFSAPLAIIPNPGDTPDPFHDFPEEKVNLTVPDYSQLELEGGSSSGAHEAYLRKDGATVPFGFEWTDNAANRREHLREFLAGVLASAAVALFIETYKATIDLKGSSRRVTQSGERVS